VERWFQNTRGLVIVVLAIATCVLLLAIEPGDGFPTGVGASSGDGSSGITVPVTTAPSVTTTTLARPTLQEGSTGADVTVLQQRLAALGFNVGAPDGNFGSGTKQAVIDFQTQKGISPADGVVNQATWNALLANPSETTTTTTKP
jgi:peptidoglycan hydrolase-like protein with peptidoglycan-binding domain